MVVDAFHADPCLRPSVAPLRFFTRVGISKVLRVDGLMPWTPTSIGLRERERKVHLEAVGHNRVQATKKKGGGRE